MVQPIDQRSALLEAHSMLDLNAVSAAITGTRDSLAASGYAIDCAEDQPGALTLTVRALDGACEECLVPKPIFSAILAQELAEGGIEVTALMLNYPLDDEA
jgi:hypothetical protein